MKKLLFGGLLALAFFAGTFMSGTLRAYYADATYSMGVINLLLNGTLQHSIGTGLNTANPNDLAMLNQTSGTYELDISTNSGVKFDIEAKTWFDTHGENIGFIHMITAPLAGHGETGDLCVSTGPAVAQWVNISSNSQVGNGIHFGCGSGG